MNREPRHRTISNSERFGYRPLAPGYLPTGEIVRRLRRADSVNSIRITSLSNLFNRLLDVIEGTVQSGDRDRNYYSEPR